ncbi:MAG TPA: AAA family ATPase [Polyangiaceae bacterium]|nr:AAA family ATPase [Polyangiaceae bacterium]
MRIARLDLAAFGPFTERSLDFGGGAPGGLHLIYGKNAAGKSSALRAVSDLLFGIPSKSSDDHVHPYQALRIRALLSNASGDPLLVQRLKRNKDSLRDEQDSPLDEMALKRLLGNVDRAMFERVFGLDHERLREAGQALLEGGGDVGESLFDAGAGGHGVRRVLLRLREEAERLFKPRGGKQEIAQLLDQYKAARDRVREQAHTPEVYVEQQRELEKLGLESQALARELSALREERERARMLQAALPGIAKRARLLVDLSALGALPELSTGFGERRQRVQSSLDSCQANLARASRELERLRQHAAELHPPEGLLGVGQDTMTSLREGIGSTKKALQDLPAREAELAEKRAEAQVVERRLGIDSARLGADALKARRPEEARFRKLLAERGALSERRRAARARLSQIELDHETQLARLGAIAPESKSEELERAVLLARHVGDVEQGLLATRNERAELALRSAAEVAALAPFDGTLAELCALRVPAGETVAHFERSFSELEERRKRTAEAMARCRERTAELSRELAAEELSGAVPSEEELLRARETRDTQFDELSKAWPEKSSKALSLFESARLREYRGTVSAADALADRLRREAARVAENARRIAERAQLADEQKRLAELETALSSERVELERNWASSWAAAGFEPVRPTEMRAWLERRERAVALVVKEAAVVKREAELEEQARALAAALTAALGALPEATPLAVSVDRANHRLDQERKAAAERAAARARIAELEVRKEAALRELQASDTEAGEHDQALTLVIAALGFEAGLGPEEVEARLEELADLTRMREQIAVLERRISGMKRDVLAFEGEVAALVASHAVDLAELSKVRAAAELVERFDRGRRDASELARVRSQISEREAEIAEQQALLAQAERDTQALLAEAQASDASELSQVEARTATARELRAALDGLTATLSATAGARGLEALIAEASATDPARLSARLDELEKQIEQLDERYSDSIRAHQRIQAGLERFSDTSAVDAAEEERALASALVRHSDRWAKLKLAEVLLEREIERYREQNQGPVLRRAAELFVALTQREYQGLRVGREERTLVAVRANDLEVGVEGLNEAARYHLYLALRLASLERYLEHADPLPLVLDDVLIHFDEEGSRAALGVLGSLSERLQILLFTHHRHNVELARTTVPTGRLFVHEL